MNRPTSAAAASTDGADARDAGAPRATVTDDSREARSSGTAPADGTAAAGAAAEGDRLRWARIDTVWALLLVLLAFTITTLGVTRAISLSAFDEASHLDYAWSVAHGNLPFAGSKMAPEVLQEWSCRSQEGAQYIIPPCGEAHPADEYPVRGENYNYAHPPTYYTVTGFAARVLDALPIGITFVTAARLTGGVWLAAALVAMYAVLRMWRMPRLGAVAAAAVMASAPSIAHASSIVTNDAPGLLAGVCGLFVLTRVVVQERLGWVLPALLAGFVTSVKVMHSVSMLAVAVVVLGLAVAAVRSGDRVRGRKLGIISVAIVGTIGVVHLGWSTFQGRRGIPGWVSPVTGINTEPVQGGPVDEWLPTLVSGFGVTQTFWLQAALSSFAVLASARLLALLMTAAPIANVSAFPAGDRRRLVGWAALVGCAAVPWLVQAQAYLNSQDYFPFVSSRYALSLFPLTMAAIAFVAQARNWRVASGVVCALVLAALLLSYTGIL